MVEKLEKMDVFFDTHVDGYDAHMLSEVEGVPEAYRAIMGLLPREAGMHVLDLGCGTGLELSGVFEAVPDAVVTGIDLSQKMLGKLHEKFSGMGKRVTLVWGDYLEYDFGVERFDVVLSVESLHHFTHEAKRALYQKIHMCLKQGGTFLNGDYMAADQGEEDAYFAKYASLAAGKPAGYFHFDTPLTVTNELALLREAGFMCPECVGQKGATAILTAKK